MLASDKHRLLDEAGVMASLPRAELDRTRVIHVAFTGARCVCCDTSVAVTPICCFGMLTLCGDCFAHMLKSTAPSFACVSCCQDYVELCKPGAFTEAAAKFRERAHFEGAVDRAYCPQCRAPCTMDAEEAVGPHATLTCEECRHVFCAFCKDPVLPTRGDNASADWLGCGPSCRLGAMLTFELVPFRYATDDAVGSMIPNRRLCPKCFALGAYDGKCKFHKCAECGTDYCFLCVQEKEHCPTSYGQLCVAEPVTQTLEMLPRGCDVDARSTSRPGLLAGAGRSILERAFAPPIYRLDELMGEDESSASFVADALRQRRHRRWAMYGGDALGDMSDPPSMSAFEERAEARAPREPHWFHDPPPPTGVVSRAKAAWRRTFPKSHGHCLAPMFTNTQINNSSYRR